MQHTVTAHSAHSFTALAGAMRAVRAVRAALCVFLVRRCASLWLRPSACVGVCCVCCASTALVVAVRRRALLYVLCVGVLGVLYMCTVRRLVSCCVHRLVVLPLRALL